MHSCRRVPPAQKVRQVAGPGSRGCPLLPSSFQIGEDTPSPVESVHLPRRILKNVTLVLVAGTRAHTVVVSDRRLTRERNKKLEVIEEEASKPAILLCRDARVVVAYTGLASIGEPPNRGPAPAGTFRTAAWLLDAVTASAPPERKLLPLIDRFSDRAEAKFESLPLKHPQKPLAVLFAGYGYVSPTDARPTRRAVANFTGSSVNSSAQFAVTEADPGHGGAYMLALGTRRAITDKHVQAVQHLIAQGRPPQALVGKVVDILRTVAADPKSRDAIGTQCDSVILPADA